MADAIIKVRFGKPDDTAIKNAIAALEARKPVNIHTRFTKPDTKEVNEAVKSLQTKNKTIPISLKVSKIDDEKLKQFKAKLQTDGKSGGIKVEARISKVNTEVLDKKIASLTKNQKQIKVKIVPASNTTEVVNAQKSAAKQSADAWQSEYKKLQTDINKTLKEFGDGSKFRMVNGSAAFADAKNAIDALTLLNKPVTNQSQFDALKQGAENAAKALHKLVQEQDKLKNDTKIGKQLISLSRQLESFRNQAERAGRTDEYNALLERLRQAANDDSASIQQLTQDIQQFGLSLTQSASPLQNFIGGFNSLFTSITGMNFANWARRTFVKACKEIYQSVKEVNTALTEFQIVAGVSDRKLGEFTSEAFATSQKISASFKDVTDAATVFRRLGFSVDDSLQLSEMTTMFSRLGDIGISDAENASTAVLKAFDMTADDLRLAMDKMVKVGNNFPISAAQIGEALNNASSALAAGGNSFDQTIALLTTANATVQDASKSSTALRTITARIRNTKAELEDLGEEVDENYNTTAKYRKELLALAHVDILDENSEFRSTFDILNDLSDAWVNLGSKEKAAITQMVAGTRGLNVFSSLMENFKIAKDVMDDLGDATGFMEDRYETYTSSIEAANTRLKNSWDELSTKILNSDFVVGAVDIGSSILQWLNKAITPDEETEKMHYAFTHNTFDDYLPDAKEIDQELKEFQDQLEDIDKHIEKLQQKQKDDGYSETINKEITDLRSESMEVLYQIGLLEQRRSLLSTTMQPLARMKLSGNEFEYNVVLAQERTNEKTGEIEYAEKRFGTLNDAITGNTSSIKIAQENMDNLADQVDNNAITFEEYTAKMVVWMRVQEEAAQDLASIISQLSDTIPFLSGLTKSSAQYDLERAQNGVQKAEEDSQKHAEIFARERMRNEIKESLRAGNEIYLERQGRIKSIGDLRRLEYENQAVEEQASGGAKPNQTVLNSMAKQLFAPLAATMLGDSGGNFIEREFQWFEEHGLSDMVDLRNRQRVSGAKMRAAGYKEFSDDDYATVYSSVMSDAEGKRHGVFTPIAQDGTVFSEKFLQIYADKYFKTGKDPRGLLLGVTDNLTDAIYHSEMLHQAQEKYYQQTQQNINTAQADLSKFGSVSRAEAEQRVKTERSEQTTAQNARYQAEQNATRYISEQEREEWLEENPLTAFGNWLSGIFANNDAKNAITWVDENGQAHDYIAENGGQGIIYNEEQASLIDTHNAVKEEMRALEAEIQATERELAKTGRSQWEPNTALQEKTGYSTYGEYLYDLNNKYDQLEAIDQETRSAYRKTIWQSPDSSGDDAATLAATAAEVISNGITETALLDEVSRSVTDGIIEATSEATGSTIRVSNSTGSLKVSGTRNIQNAETTNQQGAKSSSVPQQRGEESSPFKDTMKQTNEALWDEFVDSLSDEDLTLVLKWKYNTESGKPPLEDLKDFVGKAHELVSESPITFDTEGLITELDSLNSKWTAYNTAISNQAKNGFLQSTDVAGLGDDFTGALTYAYGRTYLDQEAAFDIQRQKAQDLYNKSSVALLAIRQEILRTNKEIEQLQGDESEAAKALVETDKDRLATLTKQARETQLIMDQTSEQLSTRYAFNQALGTANGSANVDSMRDSLRGTFESARKYGKIGTDDFKTAIDYVFGAGDHEYSMSEAAKAEQLVKAYSADNGRGRKAVLDQLFRDKGKGPLISKTKAGGYEINDNVTVQKMADQLGIGKDYMYDLLHMMSDYGDKFDFSDEYITDFVDKADTVEEKYAAIANAQAAAGQDSDKVAQQVREQAKTVEDLAAAYAYESDQIHSSSMSDEDKATAIANLQDVYQGLFDGLSDSIKGDKTFEDFLGLTDFDLSALNLEANATIKVATDPADPSKLVPGNSSSVHTIFVRRVYQDGNANNAADWQGPNIDKYDNPDKWYSGSANISGTAYTGGKWGSHFGTHEALVGELGQELMVDPHTGTWRTIGDHGPEIITVPDDAIIFNDQQTKGILAGRGVYGRGTQMHYKGTAHITGGGNLYTLWEEARKKNNDGSGGGSSSKDKDKDLLSDEFKKDRDMLKHQMDILSDMLNLYHEGSDDWFDQQSNIIDTYTKAVKLSQLEYERLIKEGYDASFKDMRELAEQIVDWQNEVFDAQQDYWEAQKDNATKALEHLNDHISAVVDLKEAHYDLINSIQDEEIALRKEMQIAKDAYPYLTDAERMAAMSNEDYAYLLNKLSKISKEASGMYEDYLAQIEEVGEDASYELDRITEELQIQYDLKMKEYATAKAELGVLKARKNLENVMQEKSVATLVGGMWVWEADSENVKAAMEELADAEQEYAQSLREQEQGEDIATLENYSAEVQAQIDAIEEAIFSMDDLAKEVHDLKDAIWAQILANLSENGKKAVDSEDKYYQTFADGAAEALAKLIAENDFGSTLLSAYTSNLGRNWDAAQTAAATLGGSTSSDDHSTTVYIGDIKLDSDTSSAIITALRQANALYQI